jgi:predicted component of viral defense system (DUF524 family)
VKAFAEAISCGEYELVAQEQDSLRADETGTIELRAESRYLVRLSADADPNVLKGALTIPRHGREGILQFGNFIGVAELGGRSLNVASNRLSADAVERMLDDVSGQLASLPFASATPTAAAYVRGRDLGPDALYHAFAVLRDAIKSRGPHDLPGAVQRVLARPFESLRPDEPRLVPLGRVSSVDAQTLSAIQSAPELLAPVTAIGLKETRLARTLDGRMPAMVRVTPLAHDNDTVENRFVVAALEVMVDVARRFERLSRSSGHVASATNAGEAAEIADQLQRWRHHQVLERLPPNRIMPVHSTVLRGRPGYREFLATYLDLLARTRLADPSDVRALLELRDAALIYEYWCFFRVVAAVKSRLGLPTRLDRFKVEELGSRVPYGYRAKWGSDVEVVYNATFSPKTSGPTVRGRDSYSVRLRPDITMRTGSGRLYLFDAKLKLDVERSFEEDDEETGDSVPPDTFRRADLYKMHAYRDALGADNVWILYPGKTSELQEYEVPWPQPGADGFQGVGAIPLRPGSADDSGLEPLIDGLLAAGA